jgi:hypothetical protein
MWRRLRSAETGDCSRALGPGSGTQRPAAMSKLITANIVVLSRIADATHRGVERIKA